MSEKKPELPYGWVVKQSKSYPDRVYYFNVNTGASTWDFPDLLKPLLAGSTVTSPTSPLVLSPSSVDQKVNLPPRDNSQPSSYGLRASHKQNPPSHKPPPLLNKSPVVSATNKAEAIPEVSNNDSKKGDQTVCKSICKGQKSESSHQGGGKIVPSVKIKSAKWSPYKNKRKNVNQDNKTSDLSTANRFIVESSYSATNEHGQPEYHKNISDLGSLKYFDNSNSFSKIKKNKNTSTPIPKRVVTNTNAKRSSDSLSRTVISSPDSKRKKLSSTPDTDLRNKLKRKQETGNGQSQSIDSDRKDYNSENKLPQKGFNNGQIIRQDTSVYRHVVRRKSIPNLLDGLLPDLGQDSDKRKVVNSLQQDLHGKRSIRVKNGSSSSVRLGVSGQDSDLTVSTGLTNSQSKPPSPSLNKNSYDEDSNNNTKTKMFIGSKDKLLSIQSWIENLQEGSDSPVPETYAQTAKYDADLTPFDKSTDSGYSSLISPKIRTERGWPGELRKPVREEREIVEMEVDTWEVTESAERLSQEAMDMDPILIEVREEVKTHLKSTCDFSLPKQSEIRKGLLIVVDTNILIARLNFLEDLRDNDIKGLGKPVLYIPWIVLQELDYLKVKLSSKRPNPATQVRACKAVSFLQSQFSNSHPRVVGQSPKQADEAAMEFSACCNDDVILQASLHCQKKYPKTHVVLLTNDINLINKAIVSNVKAFTSSKVLEGVKKLPIKDPTPAKPSSTSISSPLVTMETSTPSTTSLCSPIPNSSSVHSTPKPLGVINSPQTPLTSITSPLSSNCNSTDMKENKPQQGPTASSTSDQTSGAPESQYTEEALVDDVMCKLKKVLKEAMGRVLEVEMKAAYNDIWLDIVLRKPPWSFRDILDCWKKHWRAVFGFLFNRRLENNISDIRDNIFKVKGPSLQDMYVVCDKCLPILHECVMQKKYGSTMSDITSCVEAVQDLLNQVKSGSLSVKSLSSLDTYLKSKLDNSSSKSKAQPAHVSQAKSSSYTTTVLSGADKSQNTIDHSHINSVSHQSVPRDKGLSHNQVPYNVKSPDISPPNIQSHDQISPTLYPQSPDSMGIKSNDFDSTPVITQDHLSNSFGSCDQLLDNLTNQHSVLSEGTNQQLASAEDSSFCIEAPAGELLQEIWQLIYKCCDYISMELSGSSLADVKQQVEEQLQRLVPAAKQLRVIYTSLLETAISELPNCEDQFEALCTHCNNFFSMLQIPENIPEVPVTTTQFLVLFSSPQHRPTLEEFQQQLDAMLRHLYECLNILYPDH